MKDPFSNKIRAVGTPFLVFVGLTALTLAVLKFGIGEISKKRDELSVLSQNQKILASKEKILRQVQTSAVTQANAAAAAVPDKNPVLTVISQVRKVASDKGLIVSNVSAEGQSQEAGQLASVGVNFSLQGSLLNILEFIKSLGSISPLVTVEKVSITTSSGSSLATTQLKAYWAPFPEKIPPIAQPIAILSADESSILSKIEKLNVPVGAVISPSGPVDRKIPF